MHVTFGLDEYRKLLNTIEVELKKIEQQLQKADQDYLVLNNRKCELQMIHYTMRQSAQYVEEEDEMWIEFCELNCHRLLGFLISRL